MHILTYRKEKLFSPMVDLAMPSTIEEAQLLPTVVDKVQDNQWQKVHASGDYKSCGVPAGINLVVQEEKESKEQRGDVKAFSEES